MDTVTLLRSIRDRSLGIQLANHAPSPVPIQRTPLSLTLPPPSPIIDDLLRAGWDLSAAKQLSSTYLQHATEVRSLFEGYMNRAASAYLQVGPPTDTKVSSLHTAYVGTYQRTLSRLREDAMQRISEYTPTRMKDGTVTKRAFEKNATPILEQAFLANPYPSRANKLSIARHAGMDLKQIHVWFQNRRSRSKREGKEIRKLSFVIESTPSVYHDNLKCGPPSPVSISRTLLSPAREEPSLPTSQALCPFQINPAPHAFPNTFPPVCDYKPFPILESPQSFDTPWLRYAVIDTNQRNKEDDYPVADIDQLCGPLSRLTLTEERATSLSSVPASRDSIIACFPALVRPPPAPLPALLPITVTVHTSDYTHNTSTSLPSLSRHAVHTPALSAISNRSTATRKSIEVLSLRRDSAHPYQSRKSSRSKTYQVRSPRQSSASSLSSIVSSDSCSSRASSASLESPPPLTPPQLSVELPRSRKTSNPDLVFSPSEDLDHLFSDEDTPTLGLLGSRLPQIVQ